jgi:hypothetical protein
MAPYEWKDRSREDHRGRGWGFRRFLLPFVLAAFLGLPVSSCSTGSESEVPVGGTLSYLQVDGVTDAIFVDNTLAIFPGLRGEAGANRSILYFADVSDPFRPHLLSNLRIEPIGETSSLFAVPSLKRVYLAHFFEGVVAVDYSDPSFPRIANVFNYPGYVPANYSLYCLTGHYPYLYVPYNDKFLQIYDLSTDPDDPVPLGRIDPFPYRAYDGAAKDNVLVFAEDGTSIFVVDVSDPWAPVLKSTFNTDGVNSRPNGAAIAPDGKSAWIPDTSNGLRKIDLTNLSNPLLSLRADEFPALKVSTEGNLIGLAQADLGMALLRDAGDTVDRIVEDKQLGYAMNIHLSGNYAYVAMRDGGIKIVRIR